MDDAAKILSGLALVLAFAGAALSAVLLMDNRLRTQSHFSATLCLLCSFVYVGAFVYARGQQPSRSPATTTSEMIVPGNAASSREADFARAPVQSEAAALTARSFGDVMQNWRAQ